MYKIDPGPLHLLILILQARVRAFALTLFEPLHLSLHHTMSKRHNRKRTRSRPRHRDAAKVRSFHYRTDSFDNISTYPTTPSSPFQHLSYFPPANKPAHHWHQTYSAWQSRLRQQQEDQALEAQRLRFFGGEIGDEVSLLEPMLKVVTDLFDGNIDYEDP